CRKHNSTWPPRLPLLLRFCSCRSLFGADRGCTIWGRGAVLLSATRADCDNKSRPESLVECAAREPPIEMLVLGGPMLHNAIDLLGVVSGLLALVALWLDPRTDKNRRKFFVAALVITVVAELLFLSWDRLKEKQEQQVLEALLTNKKKQVTRLLCAN